MSFSIPGYSEPVQTCVWCGKTFEEHAEVPNPNAAARVPCGLLRSGFSAVLKSSVIKAGRGW